VVEAAKLSFVSDMENVARSGDGAFSAGSQEEGYPFAVKGEERLSAKSKIG
jgi:hypothetical protein